MLTVEQHHGALQLVGCYTSDFFFFFFFKERRVFETLMEFLLYRIDESCIKPTAQ